MLENLPKHSALFPDFLGVVEMPSNACVAGDGSFKAKVSSKQFFECFEEIPGLKLEYLPHGDLSHYIPHLVSCSFCQVEDPDRLARKWSAEILKILEELRKLIVAHRDIKPHNLLVTEKGLLKLCDFGCSEPAFDGNEICIKAGKKGMCGGTDEYLPPEMFSENPVFAPLEVDYYALGKLIFELVFGCQPFRIPCESDQSYQKFRHEPQQFWEYWKSRHKKKELDKDFITLIETLLNEDRLKRGNHKDLFSKSGEFKWLAQPAATDEEIRQTVVRIRSCKDFRIQTLHYDNFYHPR